MVREVSFWFYPGVLLIIAPFLVIPAAIGALITMILSAFLPARRENTDAYVCMYHDQGLIPLKTLAFDTAVNVTLGLPLVRTSVDHGTALDIAWDAVADPSSLYAAVHLAAKLAAANIPG